MLLNYLYEKDFGGVVGIMNQKKLRSAYGYDGRKLYNKLKMGYWVKEYDNIEDAYYSYKIYNKFSEYFIDELIDKRFKNIVKIQKLLMTNTIINKEELYKSLINHNGVIKTQFNYLFWIFRGYSKDDAIIEVSRVQKENARKLAISKTNNPDKYKDIIPNQIGYWLKMGLTVEEAKRKVSDRQSTFSLDICIKKYGIYEGNRKFTQRQKKWQNTLKSKPNNDIEEMNISKSCVRILHNETKVEYHNRVGKFVNYPIFDIVDLINFLNIHYNLSPIHKNCTVETFIRSLPKGVNNPGIDLGSIISEIGLYFPKENKIFKANGLFYNLKTEEGFYLRSSLEIDFYYRLKETGVKFEVEKFYSGTKMKSDFFFNNTHYEIAGMMGDEKYKAKMEYKKETYGAVILEYKDFDNFFSTLGL